MTVGNGEPGVAPAANLVAEWALWGKHGTDRLHRVLACSAGLLSVGDFGKLIERYAHGTADRLPQYTVLWVPGLESGAGFVGIAIHEHASYAQRDGRSRYDASGREIVFTRLFCVSYPSLAEHTVTFTQLLAAVERRELPMQSNALPLELSVTSGQPSQSAASPAPELAEVVAALLLTARPVCILGADDVPITERLAFIDEVMSLLPYGLRATMSASTWASPTAQDLKLRLFFASARPDDGNTHHLQWESPGPAGHLLLGDPTAQRYLDWLRSVGPEARFLLTTQTAPLHFRTADISNLIGTLPRDLTVVDTLEDLAISLSVGDAVAAAAEVKRLKRQLDGPVDPADRDHYHGQVMRHRLLSDHPGLNPSTKASVYQTLLKLAFQIPLSYYSYCEIEDCVDGPPHSVLRSVLMQIGFEDYVAWSLAIKAGRRVNDEELVTMLKEMGVPATAPLEALQRHVARMRPNHRKPVYDSAVFFMRACADDPRAELVRRGYLTATLEAVFPDDQQEQQARLEDSLRLVHPAPLSRGQIRDLFSDRNLKPTVAFEAAVIRLASSPHSAQLIKEQASYARSRLAGRGGDDAGNDDRYQVSRGIRRLLFGRYPRF